MSSLGATRYLALCAEQALVAGRPLAEELTGAVASGELGRIPEHLAIVRARQGELQGALEALGLDRVGAKAMVLAPAAAAEVSRKLQALPDSGELQLRLKTVAAYLLLVAGNVLLCGMVVSTFALPTLHQVASQLPGAELLRQGSLFLALGVGGAALLLLLAPFRLVNLQAARLLTAAAALVDHGLRAQEVLPALLATAPIARKQLGAHLEGGGLDAATLDAIAERLAAAAVQRMTAIVLTVRTVGTLLLLAAALGLTSSVYQAIFAMPSQVGLP